MSLAILLPSLATKSVQWEIWPYFHCFDECAREYNLFVVQTNKCYFFSKCICLLCIMEWLLIRCLFRKRIFLSDFTIWNETMSSCSYTKPNHLWKPVLQHLMGGVKLVELNFNFFGFVLMTPIHRTMCTQIINPSLPFWLLLLFDIGGHQDYR